MCVCESVYVRGSVCVCVCVCVFVFFLHRVVAKPMSSRSSAAFQCIVYPFCLSTRSSF